MQLYTVTINGVGKWGRDTSVMLVDFGGDFISGTVQSWVGIHL